MANRLSKKESTRVTVHKGRNSLGSNLESFESIEDVKSFVRSKYKKNGIVSVFISQDGGYSNSFNVNTN